MIRAAAEGDYDAVMGLMGELGVDDPLPDAARWLRESAPSTLVSEDASGVVGYVNCSRLETAAHVLHLVVAQRARRAGVGRALMLEVAARLGADGVGEWHLNVKADNAPAIRVYERLGLREAHRSAVVRLRWELALPDDPDAAAIVAAPIEPAHDAELEGRFGLLAGRLARARARDGRVLMQLREHGVGVGLAVFDPRFPGAAPFCVARPTLAGALVRALRPHAPPGPDMQVVIENDAPLVESFEAAGATLKLRLIPHGRPRALTISPTDHGAAA